tara:strand:- start:302 stop:445 length:144 start_codon:yes stop_codon:yes gene_type:complete
LKAEKTFFNLLKTKLMFRKLFAGFEVDPISWFSYNLLKPLMKPDQIP